MKKSEAIYMFHGVSKLSKGTGLTRAAIYKWPDELPQRTVDLILGAAARLGVDTNAKEPEALK